MSDDKPDPGQMWHDWFVTNAFTAEKRLHHNLRLLPHDPRCKFCNAPFEGIGGVIVRTLYGRKRSSLNPRFCNVCETTANKNPGGQEVEMSMLFADVRGSTELSEQMSPTEFREVINRFYVKATNAIIQEDGLVEKLAGDAVAAFWGSGFAGPDYVARTVHAAQNILKIMEQQKIPVGIGVHAGVAFLGTLGGLSNGELDFWDFFVVLEPVVWNGREVNENPRTAFASEKGDARAALKLFYRTYNPSPLFCFLAEKKNREAVFFFCDQPAA